MVTNERASFSERELTAMAESLGKSRQVPPEALPNDLSTLPADELVKLLVQAAAGVGSYLGELACLRPQVSVVLLAQELRGRLTDGEMLRADVQATAQATFEDGSDA